MYLPWRNRHRTRHVLLHIARCAVRRQHYPSVPVLARPMCCRKAFPVTRVLQQQSWYRKVSPVPSAQEVAARRVHCSSAYVHPLGLSHAAAFIPVVLCFARVLVLSSCTNMLAQQLESCTYVHGMTMISMPLMTFAGTVCHVYQ